MLSFFAISLVFQGYLLMLRALGLITLAVDGRDAIRTCRGKLVVANHPTLLDVANPAQGLKAGGVLVVNTDKGAEEVRRITHYAGRIATVDATRIAIEVIGRPITNTTMLGALVAVAGVVKPESLTGPMNDRFGKLAARNLKALARAMAETKVEG